MSRASGNRLEETESLSVLSNLAYDDGRAEEGWSLACQALENYWQIGARLYAAEMLKKMAFHITDPRTAVLVFSAGLAGLERYHFQDIKIWEEEVRPHLSRLQAELGESAYLLAWGKGQSFSLDEVIHQVLAYQN